MLNPEGRYTFGASCVTTCPCEYWGEKKCPFNAWAGECGLYEREGAVSTVCPLEAGHDSQIWVPFPFPFLFLNMECFMNLRVVLAQGPC